MGYFENIRVLNLHFNRDAQDAQWMTRCPDCDAGSMVAIALGLTPARWGYHQSDAQTAWLVCPVCGGGAYAIGAPHLAEEKYPSTHAFVTPDNLSEAVTTSWLEAQRSYSASAYTGCVLLCRKLIFHMAVENGLPEKDEKGWAPNFDQCVNQLVVAELITGKQRDRWVDSIRVMGNAATHDLESISQKDAARSMKLTQYLLQMVYEFQAEASGEN